MPHSRHYQRRDPNMDQEIPEVHISITRQSPKLKRYKLPDQTPDTRFVLFDKTEIQVHSIILKLYSAFFRKFLDSPDKKPAAASAKFQYEWVSKIEEDGEWHVVEKSNAKPNDHVLLKGTSWDSEVLLFMEMLNALYRIPYKIWVDRLNKVTKMADYYRCLPAVSHNLLACFSQTNNYDYIVDYSVPLLEIAYKLRQPLLFKDCLIYVAGHMPPGATEPPYFCKKVLSDVVMKARNEVNRRVVQCQREIMVSAPNEERSKLLGQCWESGSEEAGGELSLPRYFRLLVNHDNKFAMILRDVLQCELHLPCELDQEAGGSDSGNMNQFYCARLSDEDLPWDPTETDW
ncbi:hypothetical protein OCU04_004987 [Sclerotinia nivalis]|uniref:BTB domain-containing protein n=1 Tax=Sclerotinia nivalis TaxID=352851 RepID=A0A9X0AN63_9HELO|nr:hypothetical protein OCU04_004987 [Sclerotinia nivalis]